MLRKILAFAPFLDRSLRHLYLRMKFPGAREPGFTCWVDPRLVIQTPWEWAGIESEAGELFFGYYDKPPWSPDGDAMIMHFRRNSSEPEIEIRVFQRRSRSCQIVGHSRAWNFQQGAMAQWITRPDQVRLIYNDIVDDNLVSRIVTSEGKEEAVIPVPVQTVHPDGKIALSLNYRRLWKLRREYGYPAAVRNFSADQPLDQDGIWRADLTSGQTELIITLADLMQISPRPGMNTQRNKVNHIMYSPGGNKCVFMHRWFTPAQKHSRLFVMDNDSLQLNLILDHQLVSHYSWLDDERLIVYGRAPDGITGYFELNVTTGRHRAIGGTALDHYGDGHPSPSPDGSWLVTDSYPDRRFQQQLILYHIASGGGVSVGRFLHPPRYYALTRCDLHPRWSRDGQNISFDSVWNGTRQSYILDVSRIVRDGI